MRCFISIDIENETVRDNLMKITDACNQIDGFNPVARENLHITVLFIGDVNEQQCHEITELFTDHCSSLTHGSFECMITGLGVFPHMNYISVVWGGVEDNGEISQLHSSFRDVINEVCEGVNAGNEHDFVPHVTLGRVKYVDAAEKSRLQDLVRERSPVFGTIDVSDVRLKESVLQDDGPEYRDMAVCAL